MNESASRDELAIHRTHMIATPNLIYLVLRCADLERSRAFYAALGLGVVAEQHGSGAKHYSCDAGGIVLELYPLYAMPTAGARLGFRVEQIEAVAEAGLRAGGWSFAQIRLISCSAIQTATRFT